MKRELVSGGIVVDPALRRSPMKASFVTASLCLLLLSGLLRGQQSSGPDSRAEEIVQLRKQIETLEERVERLENRLDRIFRPRVVPLTSIGVPRELP
jgi:chromosome segregation ATPase